MSFASSSSSAGIALRSASGTSRRCVSAIRTPGRIRPVPQSSQISARSYSDVAEPGNPSTPPRQPLTSTSPSSASRKPGFGLSSTPPDTPIYRGGSTLTASQAQTYLTDLLHLPPSSQFPAKLALQILTHKSYRFVSLPRNPYLQPTPLPEEQEHNWAASHNARLSFLGRRAMSTYLAMFVHAAIATSGLPLKELDFLRGTSLENKLANLTHVTNVGREVGAAWGVADVVRWDHNPVNTGLTIHGMAVEAVIGGVFTQFGSPAAHRAFHLYALPHLARQLRDPMLIEKAQVMRKDIEGDLAGGILV